MLTSLVVSLVLSGSTGELAAQWKARAERATRNLLKPGLDVCDRAVEVAFQTAQNIGTEAMPMYALTITIGSRSMLAGWAYKGTKLVDFSVMELPPRWMAHQGVDSRTLSVVLGTGEKCAFDLCVTDPFAEGPCAEPKR
jgi:hypothetical protein